MIVTTDREQISSTLDIVFGTETTMTVGWNSRALLRLLSEGEPVTVQALAAAHDEPVENVRRALAVSPDVEYDGEGRIVGAGITLRPTPHRFEVNGQVLYTWCAMDTLIYPRMLGRTARVTSPCATTGAPVRLVVVDTGVTGIDPPAAVVSMVTPEDLSSVRSAFCAHVHFFVDAQAAQPWLDRCPGASVLSIDEAYALGRDLTVSSTCHDTSPGSCH